MTPSEESIWAKTSGCNLGRAPASKVIKIAFPSWFSANSLIRWRFMVYFPKKTVPKISGLAAHPKYDYAYASIASIKGVANEFEN
jgi:hypothetical protein